MKLSRPQKRYLKANIHRLPFSQVSTTLNLSEKELLAYLRQSWDTQKYHKFTQNLKIRQKDKEKRELTVSTEDFSFKEFIKQNWLSVFLLTLLVIITYANSLTNDFVSDDLGIFEGLAVRDWEYYLTAQPRTFVRALIYVLAFLIGDHHPIFFRLPNIFFHLGAVISLYILSYLLTKKEKLSLITAAIFAVHPVLVESVTWISGGVYAQYSFLVIATLVFYLLSKSRLRYYYLSLGFSLLAFFTSEKSIILFLLVLLLDFCFFELRKTWFKVLPFIALSIGWGIFYLAKIGERMSILESQYSQSAATLNPLQQIPVAIVSYLQLIFWPSGLTLYHSEMSFSQGKFVLIVILFLIFFSLIVFTFFKNRLIFFFLAFFVISLLPMLTPFGISWIVAERYVYLGAMGIIFSFIYLVSTSSEKKGRQTASYIFFSVLIIALMIRSMVRNIDWKNQDNLWLSAAKTSPSSPQNHNNLGDYYARHQNFNEAVIEFQKAIALNPQYADAYHNLGNTYEQMGEREKALENYEKALEFKPTLWQSYQNMAGIYFNQEKWDLAVEKMQKAITISPHDANLYANLGIIYLKIGDKVKAQETLVKALELDPGNANIQGLLNQVKEDQK